MGSLALASRTSSSFSAWLRAPALAALAVLGAVLPFEMMRPLALVGPLQLSSVEVVLYAAVALGGLSLAADVIARRFVLPWGQIVRRHAGPIAWGAALVLTAVAAPTGKTMAAKFALRSLGGLALYAAAVPLLRAPGAALLVAGAITAGSVAAAALMWGEIYLPRVAAALLPFHLRTFDVFGTPRASGPFQFANIAAMYLEAALPVALVVVAAVAVARPAASSGRFRFVAAALALAALLGGAIALTASRAGLVTSVVVLTGLALTARRRGMVSGKQLAAALAGVAVLLAGGVASVSGLRLAFWRDAVWYRSSVTLAPGTVLPAAMRPGKAVTIAVDVRNRGARVWPARGNQPVRLTYHWADPPSGRPVVFEGWRTVLPRDLAPGEAVRLNARVFAPREPGRYRLQLAMVHEHVTWFSEQGDAFTEAIVDVDPAAPATPSTGAVPLAQGAAGGEGAAAADADSRPAGISLDRPQLWRAALLAFREHPLTGVGPDNFRHVFGRYLGRRSFDERLHANNLYLETLADEGLCGVAALALLLVGLAQAAGRALRRHPAGSPAGLLALGAAAGLAAYPVHGVLDYFLMFTPTYGLAWLLAGMLVGLGEESAA
jgi:hypothetical protein